MFTTVLLIFLCVAVLVLFVTMVHHLLFTVPFVPTPMQVVDAMINAAELKGHEHVYDLGAGDARFLIRVKELHPGCHAIGCELVPAIWLLGMLRIWWSGKKVTLRCQSAYSMDVRNADVLLLYLLPSMLGALGERFDRELRPGTRVISNTFRFPGREPVKTLKIGKKTIFVYQW